MPQYLRTVTVRLLEASTEALNLALIALAVPRRRDPRVPASRYAGAMGLIGTAAENAMSAVLVQVFGEDALRSGSGGFKTARELLSDLRGLLKNPVPRASFLSTGLPDAKEHLERILGCLSGFSIAITERAAGLHAGSGPNREAALVAAGRVRALLEVLAASSRVRPYLDDIPRLPAPILEPNVLVDDLLANLSSAESEGEKSAALRALFLILPEAPQNEPDWIGALERVSLAPADGDLALLVRTLEAAIPVQLQRASGKGQGLSVAVRPGDARALPIAVQHLRRSFTEIADQWSADVGTANGRLGAGILDCPPEDFVLDLFGLGAEMKDAIGQDSVSAHEIWPFVATSLIRSGTPGPYWFLVRMTTDWGQLAALLDRALDLAGGKVDSRRKELVEGIEALRESRSLPAGSSFYNEIKAASIRSTAAREKLARSLERHRDSERAFPPEGEVVLRRASAGEVNVGEALDVLISGNSQSVPATRYWGRVLCEAASDPLDRKPLIGVLRRGELAVAHTAARKALRLIDVLGNGPAMELEDA